MSSWKSCGKAFGGKFPRLFMLAEASGAESFSHLRSRSPTSNRSSHSIRQTDAILDFQLEPDDSPAVFLCEMRWLIRHANQKVTRELFLPFYLRRISLSSRQCETFLKIIPSSPFFWMTKKVYSARTRASAGCKPLVTKYLRSLWGEIIEPEKCNWLKEISETFCRVLCASKRSQLA